jgi:Lrp/AsnC family transcriptional regulator, involved in the regulation of lysine biosynthesis
LLQPWTDYYRWRKKRDLFESIDPTDVKIIKILQSDSRKAFVEIANEIGLSESAVRRRVKNLTRREIIKKFTVEISTGDKTSAITLISVNSTSDTSFVSGKLMGLDGVEVIYEITGQYDIAAVISAPSISEINKCIDEVRKTEGVSDTNTVIILKTIR